MKITVFCTTQFEGFHCWPQAPREVDYLRSLHRHIFHVRAEKEVPISRHIEFITLRHQVDAAIAELQAELSLESVPTWSCETMAILLLKRLELSKCEVSEDNENGAIVEA